MANIMVVDDSPIIRRSLREMLEAMGHSVVAECEDGREAVQLYLQYQIDLVTMDIQLPGIDGIEAVRLIREYNPNAVIIMISSVEHRNKVYEAIKLGAKHYIVKPYTVDKVSEVIEAVLGAHPFSLNNGEREHKAKSAGAQHADSGGRSAVKQNEEKSGRFAKKREPLALVIPSLPSLPYELVLKDGRVVMTIQRHISEGNVRSIQACLQGLLYYRKAKFVIDLWETITHDEGLRLLLEFVSAVRGRNGTVAIVTVDASHYTQLKAQLRNGVYHSYAEIEW